MIGCEPSARKRQTVAALTALLTLAVARGTPAHAQTADATDGRAQAQLHLSRGNDLFTGDKFQEALTEFQAAFAAFPSPKLHFNIGQCQRALGRRTEALAEFRRFVDEAGDVSPDLRGEAERYIAELTASEAAPPTPPPPIAPPAPALALASPAPTAPPLVTPAPPAEPDAARPIYKRWWFWAAVGVIAAGAATGAVLWARSRDPSCNLDNCIR